MICLCAVTQTGLELKRVSGKGSEEEKEGLDIVEKNKIILDVGYVMN